MSKLAMGASTMLGCPSACGGHGNFSERILMSSHRLPAASSHWRAALQPGIRSSLDGGDTYNYSCLWCLACSSRLQNAGCRARAGMSLCLTPGIARSPSSHASQQRSTSCPRGVDQHEMDT